MPTIPSGSDGREWPIIKQIIYSELGDTNLEINIYYFNKNNITQNWKTDEHNKIIQNIRDLYSYKNIDTINTKNQTLNKNTIAANIFATHKPGENVPSDGNCGLYALCNALNDNKNDKITSIMEISELLNLAELPGYWWSDEELASIADHYNFDTYIYDDKNKVTNCLSLISLFPSKYFSSLFFIRRSKNLPMVLSRQIGLSSGFVPFRSNTRLAVFQLSGKMPWRRQILYIC